MFNPRRQGDLGELSAIEWLVSRGHPVWLPLGHSPDADLITRVDGRLAAVQVKTATVVRKGRFDVTLATRGGNQSWSGLVKRFSAERCDWLSSWWATVAAGSSRPRRSAEARGSAWAARSTPSTRSRGGARYPRRSPLDRYPVGASAGFPSGQRDETVNLAAQPSQVRILPPP
jgi:hypothetical protein